MQDGAGLMSDTGIGLLGSNNFFEEPKDSFPEFGIESFALGCSQYRGRRQIYFLFHLFVAAWARERGFMICHWPVMHVQTPQRSGAVASNAGNLKFRNPEYLVRLLG